MTQLVVHVCPSCEDGRFSVPTHVGDVVAVFADDHVFSELERKHFAIVRTDKSIEECRALYLAHGVPDEIHAARKDAEASLMAAIERNPIVPAEVDAATSAIAAARYDRKDYPARRVKLDVSKLPMHVVHAVRKFKKAVDAKRPEAHEAKAAARAAVLDHLGLSPAKAAKLLSPHPSKKVDFKSVAVDDALVDEIRSTEAAGWALVIEPVEQSFAPLEHVTIGSVALDAMTIVKVRA
jgi:hypothetical protein